MSLKKDFTLSETGTILRQSIYAKEIYNILKELKNYDSYATYDYDRKQLEIRITIRKEVDENTHNSMVETLTAYNSSYKATPSASQKSCLTCGGKGEILGFPKNYPCQSCDGTGHDFA